MQKMLDVLFSFAKLECEHVYDDFQTVLYQNK